MATLKYLLSIFRRGTGLMRAHIIAMAVTITGVLSFVGYAITGAVLLIGGTALGTFLAGVTVPAIVSFSLVQTGALISYCMGKELVYKGQLKRY
jgi:hypothetical protein